MEGVLKEPEMASGIEFEEEIKKLYHTYKNSNGSKLLEREHAVMLACWKHIKFCIQECPAGDVVREVMANEFFSIEPPKLQKP